MAELRIDAEVSRLNGCYQGYAAAPGRMGVVTGFLDSAEEAWRVLHDAISRVASSRGMRVLLSPAEAHRRTYIIEADHVR